MIKNKIAFRLTLYFSIALLVFATVIGSVFMILFRNHTFEIHQSELEKRATIIASNIAPYFENQEVEAGSGYGAYIRFSKDIVGSDVWIIDKELNLITFEKGVGIKTNKYTVATLPENAEKLISKVFTNQVVTSRGFSEILNEATLTIGVPIISSNGTIIGAILLHSPVIDTTDAIDQGVIILAISITIAFVVGLLLSLLFSFSFTEPLTKMKTTAAELAEGTYDKKTNITQHDEIGELATTIDILAEKLDEASKNSHRLEKMRQDFIANISHELRTPVTVMRGSLEAIVDKVVVDPDMIDEYHVQMLNEAKFLQRLIGDLLDLSKLQNVDFTIDNAPLSLQSVIDDAIRSGQHIAKNKNITIQKQFDKEDKIIYGDYGRVRQMILVVLTNAIKFSNENSVIDVIMQDNKLSIHDNGQGIDEALIPTIFEKFHHSRDESNKCGTGLGLAIAKQIANRHNIDIIVESTKNVGSTFTFVFNKIEKSILDI